MKCLPQGIPITCCNSFASRFGKSVFLLLLFSGFLAVAANAQTILVNGRVLSTGDSVLANATVQIKGTKVATQTDAGGRFSIKAPANGSLIVSFVGFAEKEVPLGRQTNITIALEPLPNQMSDVIVVGYGKQKAPTVTGSIGQITGKDLVETRVPNISNMLVGRTAGIAGIQAGGEPGTDATTIRIRGVATLNGQDPLIVIDGIQQPAENPMVILNAMDANEVESISVLKDASATAVYGIRGANGVIIITTKRGKISKPQFTFSANQGYTRATSMFEMANSLEYATMRNESIRNTQAAGDHSVDNFLFSDDELWKFKNNRDYTPAEVDAMPNLTDAQKASLKNSAAIYYTDHNYYNELFDGTGRLNQYNLNVSGGTEKVKYFTSLGYLHQTGILTNSDYGGANTNPKFDRYNFRSNFDIDVIKNFKLSFNIGGQSSRNRIVGSGGSVDYGNRYQGIIQGIMESPPYVGPGFVDGKLVTGFLGWDDVTVSPLGDQKVTGRSPIASFLTGGTRTIYTTTLNTAVTLTHNMSYLTKGLEAHVRVAYDNSYAKHFLQTNRIPTYSIRRDPSDPNNIIFVGGIIDPISVDDNAPGNSTWRKIYVEGAVNYRRTFGAHSVSGLFLANAQKYTQNGQSFNTPSGLMGLVGRVTYDFKERYLVEFNMGLNGTENFAPGKRFGYFPAISGGWILSNESFFKPNKIVSFVKLRGSYGEVGNDQIGGRRYLYLPATWVANSAGYYFGSTDGSTNNPYFAGASQSALGNPVVTWERAKKVNLAADLRFLNDKLSFTASYFRENRNNILVTSGVIPAPFGVPQSSTAPINDGRVSNRGFELELNWNDKIGDVTYFLKGSYSFARNKIEYMAEAPYPYDWMNVTGFSIGQYKGYLSDGFFNTEKELANRPYNASGATERLGSIKLRDITGDGIINEQDRVPIGYSNLPQVNFNLSVGLTYAGFDVSALFIGTAKGSFPQFGYILNTPFAAKGSYGQVLKEAYDGRWTAEKYAKGEKITYPSHNFLEGNPNVLSDFWMRSSNFMRLKNLEIGYTFDKKSALLARANIRGVRVYVNGNNLATWGSNILKGIDPEQADTGKNNNGYLFPLTRTYNFGLNIQF